MANPISPIRLTGIASGLDTEKIIEDLMRAERIPLQRLEGDKQIIEWKREALRSITSLLRDFSSTYLNVVNSAKNMMSSSFYSRFNVSIIGAGGAPTLSFSATAGASAVEGSKSVIIKQIATAAKEFGTAPACKAPETESLSGELALSGKKMLVTLDGVTKEITLSRDYDLSQPCEGEALAADLEALFTQAFGKGLPDGVGGYLSKIRAVYDGQSGKISFDTGGGANVLTFSSAGEDDALSLLGIADGASNRLDLSKTLLELKDSFAGNLEFFEDEEDVQRIAFRINDETFSFTADTKLQTVISTVNSSKGANVTLSYDMVSGKFQITAKQTGAGKTINIENIGGTFFGAGGAIGIDHTAAGFGSGGADAVVVIDGQEIVRGQNTFTVDGITYTLYKAEPDVVSTLSITQDYESVITGIREFVAKYNELLDTLRGKFTEKYDRTYRPLTQEQKDTMKEEDIKRWEEKAKAGLLQSDPTLLKLYNELRAAVSDPIEGLASSLAQIGISSKSYQDYGKLSIDEEKLRAALQNSPETVMNVFAKRSETLDFYSRKASGEEKRQRYAEEGFANRLYDIIEEYTSFMMDADGNRGILLMKAGNVGDTNDITSSLGREITQINQRIELLNERLLKKEDNYYKKFTAMEIALSKLNSQTTWIAAQLSALTGGNN